MTNTVPRSILLSSLLTFLFMFGNLNQGINNPGTQFYAVSLGASAATVGLLLSIANVNAAITRVPLGLRMDRYGIKRIMTYAFSISFFALLVALLSNRWEFLAFAMLSAGLGDGILMCSQKYRISRSTNTDNRSMAFSIFFTANFIAKLIGSTISGLLIQNFGFHLPYIVASFITVFGLILSLKLPEVKAHNPTDQTSSISTLENLKSIDRTVWLMTLFKTSFNSINGIITVVYPLLLRYFFNLDYTTVGLVLTINSIANLAGLFSAGRVSSTSGRMKILASPLLMTPLFIAFYAFSGNLTVIILLMCSAAFVTGLIIPTMDAFLADSAKSANVGLSFGIMDTVMRIGIAGGNLIGGYTSEQFGFFSALIAAGLIAVIPSCTMLVIRRNLKCERSTN